MVEVTETRILAAVFKRINRKICAQMFVELIYISCVKNWKPYNYKNKA